MTIDTTIRTPDDCILATYAVIGESKRRAFFLNKVEGMFGVRNKLDECAIWARESIGDTFAPQNDRAQAVIDFVRNF